MKSRAADIDARSAADRKAMEELVNQGRRYRVAMVLAIGASYGIDVVVLSLYCLVQRFGPEVPAAYGLAGMVHVAFFATLHASGASDRTRDPHLTLGQMVFGLAIQLGALAFVPAIRAYFLGVIFIVFSFASLRLSLRKLLALWLGACVGIGAVFLAFPAGSIVPVVGSATPGDALIAGGSYASVLLRCLLLNHYATTLRQLFAKRTTDLSAQVREERARAERDGLTGALNRRGVLPLLEAQASLAYRHGAPCAIAMLDVDHFKAINDRFGHLAGDDVLRVIVRTVVAGLRPADRVARYGGEEFLLLMPSTTAQEGALVVERLRADLSRQAWPAPLSTLRLTVSAGLAQLRAGESALEAIERADKALYAAKEAGRDRLVLAP